MLNSWVCVQKQLTYYLQGFKTLIFQYFILIRYRDYSQFQFFLFATNSAVLRKMSAFLPNGCNNVSA